MSATPAVVLAVSELAPPRAAAMFAAVASRNRAAASDLLRQTLAERPRGVSELLLSRAAVVLRDDPFGQQRFSSATPVHLASFLGSLATLREMILALKRSCSDTGSETDVGRVVGSLCDGCTSAAHLAAWGGDHAECLELVCRAGCDVSQRRASGATVLYIAAARGFTRCVRAALALGASPRAAHKVGGITPVMIACEHGHAESVAALLSSDPALASCPDNDGCPPLSRVLEMQQDASALPIVRILLGMGADPTTSASSFKQGQEPGLSLEQASSTTPGRSQPARVEDADCAIHTAAELGRPACLEALLDSVVLAGMPPSSGVDVRGGARWTPLMMASLHGHDACVRVCLDRGANANARSEDGHTPLMLAARNGHATIVWQLVRRGANVSARHGQGGTALFFAAEQGRLDCVRVLVRAGSDPFEASANGTSPVMAALRGGHASVVKWLTIACGAPLFPATAFRGAPLIRRKLRRRSLSATALLAGVTAPLLCPSLRSEAAVAAALTVGSRQGLGEVGFHRLAGRGERPPERQANPLVPLRFADCLREPRCRDKLFSCLSAAVRADCADVLRLAFAPQHAHCTRQFGGVEVPSKRDDDAFDSEPLLSRGGLGLTPHISKSEPHATLLHVAAQCGANRAVRALLEFGANPLVRAAKIKVDCLYTAPSGGVTTLDLILRASAAAVSQTRRWPVALRTDGADPVNADEVGVVESGLLESRDDAGLAVLHAAAERSGTCVARLLIAGANPAAASAELRESPLHHAAAYSSAGVTAAVLLMLGSGRSLLFCKNATGETAREVADSVAHAGQPGQRPPVALLLERAEELARSPITGSSALGKVPQEALELFHAARAADERFGIRQLHSLAIKRGRAVARILDGLPLGQRAPAHVLESRPRGAPRLTQLHAAIAVTESGLARKTVGAIRRAIRAASWTSQRARLVLWRRGMAAVPPPTRRRERRWKQEGAAQSDAAALVRRTLAMLHAHHDALAAACGPASATIDVGAGRRGAESSQRALHAQWLAAMRLCQRMRAALMHPPADLTALVRCALPAALSEMRRRHRAAAVPQGPPALALRGPRAGGGSLQSPSSRSRRRFPLAMAGAFGRPPPGDQPSAGQQRD